MIKYVALAGLAGFFLPLQALINAYLGARLTGPFSAALANFVVGLIAILVYLVVMRAPLPTFSQIGSTPLWSWAGGVIGASFIAAAVICVPKLGTAGLFAAIIAAQLIASLIFDHFGVLHPAQPVGLVRILGAGFLMLGVYLILRPQA
jgi:transporter family-2 protein